MGSLSRLILNWGWETRILYSYIFICISVLTTWQLNGYFILIFMFLFNKCIDKLLGYCRITLDNHLFLGILNFSMFSMYFRWHSGDLAFVCCWIFCICHGLCYLAYILFSICLANAFNLYSCLVFHSCGIQVKAWDELDKSFIEPVHLLALQITPASSRF